MDVYGGMDQELPPLETASPMQAQLSSSAGRRLSSADAGTLAPAAGQAIQTPQSSESTSICTRKCAPVFQTSTRLVYIKLWQAGPSGRAGHTEPAEQREHLHLHPQVRPCLCHMGAYALCTQSSACWGPAAGQSSNSTVICICKCCLATAWCSFDWNEQLHMWALLLSVAPALAAGWDAICPFLLRSCNLHAAPTRITCHCGCWHAPLKLCTPPACSWHSSLT